MLKRIRNKKTAKKIWIGLALIIVPAFVFWGFGGAMRSGKESGYVGKISGKKITFSEYRDAVEAVRNQIILQYGIDAADIANNIDIESEAWQRLILLNEARRRGIKVSDAEVIEYIKTRPLFQRKGSFNNELYNETLRYYFRAQPRIFEEQVRQNLMLLSLYKAVTSDLVVSEEEIKETYRKMNEEVSISYISAAPSEFGRDIAATDEDIKDYYNNNSHEFKEPISFNVEYISFDSEDKIKNVLPLANKKGGFERAAKESGAEVKETGLFPQTGAIPGIGWSPEVMAIISKLKPGQSSGPIYADKKYYIIRLKERQEPYVPELEKIRNKVKEAFIRKKSREYAQKKIEDCLGELKQQSSANPEEADFDKLAKKYGLKSDTTPLFKYGSYIQGIGSSDNFWMAAQGLKENEPSDIIPMPSGFYLIKVKSRVPVEDKKFEAEKADFSQRLLQHKKEEYFLGLIDTLAKKAQLLY